MADEVNGEVIGPARAVAFKSNLRPKMDLNCCSTPPLCAIDVLRHWRIRCRSCLPKPKLVEVPVDERLGTKEQT